MQSGKNTDTIINSQIKSLTDNKEDMTIASFNFCALDEETVNRLAKAIENNTHLKILSLLDCRMDRQGIKILSEAIQLNHSIVEISIEKPVDDSKEISASIEKIEKHVAENKNRIKRL